MTTRILAVGRTQPPYLIVEVLPGIRLALLPGESIEQVAAMWAAHLAETERRPGMSDPLTAAEAAALGLTDEDYQAAIASAPAWCYDDSDDEPGADINRHPWLW